MHVIARLKHDEVLSITGLGFGGTEKTALRYIQHYVKPQLAARLREIGILSGEHYDWSINATEE